MTAPRYRHRCLSITFQDLRGWPSAVGLVGEGCCSRSALSPIPSCEPWLGLISDGERSGSSSPPWPHRPSVVPRAHGFASGGAETEMACPLDTYLKASGSHGGSLRNLNGIGSCDAARRSHQGRTAHAALDRIQRFCSEPPMHNRRRQGRAWRLNRRSGSAGIFCRPPSQRE